MSRLEGKVAIISGASSGIGKQAARAFARRGCRMLLAARRLDHLHMLADDLAVRHPEIQALPLQMDLTDFASIDSAVARGLEAMGTIDILVNDAGVGEFDWLEALDPLSGIANPIAVNLTGAIYLTRAVLPGMMAQRGGHVVFVASLAGLVATPTYSVYAATKSGLLAFADSLRREVGIWGIQVSTLLPGPVGTGFASASVARRRTGLTTPPGWVLSQERVGEAVARLAEHPRRQWIIPWWIRPLVWIGRAWPWMIDRVVETVFVRRERGGKGGGGP
jgi:short-subunit dehydrogenase